MTRDDPALLAPLDRTFASDPAVCVLLDRRVAHAHDWAGRERRRPAGIDHDLRFRWVIVRAAQTPVHPGGTESALSHHGGGLQEMSETERSEVRQQLERWIEESQGLLSRILPSLLDDNERLRGKVAAAEEDADRMRMEVGQLRREIGDLQKEVADLQGEKQCLLSEQAAVGEAVGRAMHHLNQVLQPMNEIMRRIRAAEPAPVDEQPA